jgi:hypothetical protein
MASAISLLLRFDSRRLRIGTVRRVLFGQAGSGGSFLIVGLAPVDRTIGNAVSSRGSRSPLRGRQPEHECGSRV